MLIYIKNTYQPIMKFCPQCENMFYLRIGKENPDQLSYVCRFCQFQSPAEPEAMVQVLNTHVNHREINFHHIINKYTKYDPTLPVMENAVCPRPECNQNKEQKDRVLYMRYDEENLKYLYICSKCDHFWRGET